jgi:tRNA nucleotidyltransferase (CCA-adding enzyme)
MAGLLKIFENCPKRLSRIQFLSKLFEQDGFELRIAGGAVRDIISGKEPKDIDLATTARPEQSLDIVKKHESILRIILTAAGQRHGTIAVKFKEVTNEQSDKKDQLVKPEYDDESPYEITTLRCDKVTDGRHAEVEFISDWYKDAERRDLTINAMFLTLDDGRLIDYFNGATDLKQGVVRFVGDSDKRIKEDYLRILRFFRFWSRYGKGNRPDDVTLNAIQANLSGLNQISGERIWQEIKKILSHLPCRDVLELMLKLRVLDYAGLSDVKSDYDAYCAEVLNEVEIVEQNIRKWADLKNPMTKRDEELIPIMLFAPAVQTESLCLNAYKRVKFSKLERDTILYLIENRNKCVPLDDFKFQLAMAPGPERHMVLQRARAYLISRGLFDYIDELEQWQVPRFPIDGRAVAEAVKKKHLPIKRTRQILESVKLEWAKSGYSSDEALLMQMIQTKLDQTELDQQT